MPQRDCPRGVSFMYRDGPQSQHGTNYTVNSKTMPDLRLTFADAAIIVARAEGVLRLPRALARTGSANTARVRVRTGDREEEREVEVGLRGDVYIEIAAGLREGEQVIGE